MKIKKFDTQKLLDLGYKPLIIAYCKEVPDVDTVANYAVYTQRMETMVTTYAMTRSGKKIGYDFKPVSSLGLFHGNSECQELKSKISSMQKELISAGAITNFYDRDDEE